MTRRHRIILGVAFAALHVSRAAAEPTHVTVPATITSSTTGHTLDVPPGYYLTEDDYDRWDLETKHLQDNVTRLDAENSSLKDSAAGWQPGWKTLAVTFVLGVAGGVYAYERWID